MENIIEIKNLCKSYKDLKAVSNLSFKVKEGEFFSLLGINGAGKSTTISAMCAQIEFDDGDIYIDGENIKNNKNSVYNKIGVVFQESLLDKDLSVYDNLKFRAALYGIYNNEFESRLVNLCRLFEMKDLLNKTLKTLSGGQKRKVDIVRALLHNPKILILDEPTTGLDPKTRSLVWKNLNDMRKNNGLTIFLTTHYMEEVEDADYVVILDKGNIKCEGSPYYLKSNYASDYLIIYNVEESVISSLGYDYSKVNNGFKLKISNTSKALEILLSNKDLFKDFEVIKGSIDDVFLNVTGKTLGGNIK